MRTAHDVNGDSFEDRLLAFHRLLLSFEPERGVYFTTYLARMLAPAVFSAERSARRYQEHLVENEPQEGDHDA